MELNKREHFTKEQLIAHITAKAARIRPDSQVNDSRRIEALMNKRVLEIALATLTAEKAHREHCNGWPLAYSDYAAGRNDCLDELLDMGEGNDN